MPGKNLLLLTEKNILKYGSWFAVYCAVIHHVLPVPDKGLGTRQSTVSLRNISELYMQSSCFVLVPETLECMSPQRRGRREPVLYPCGTPTWTKMGKVLLQKGYVGGKRKYFVESRGLDSLYFKSVFIAFWVPKAQKRHSRQKLQNQQCNLLVYTVQRMQPCKANLSPYL